jgi:hypothetical protein
MHAWELPAQIRQMALHFEHSSLEGFDFTLLQYYQLSNVSPSMHAVQALFRII